MKDQDENGFDTRTVISQCHRGYACIRYLKKKPSEKIESSVKAFRTGYCNTTKAINIEPIKIHALYVSKNVKTSRT